MARLFIGTSLSTEMRQELSDWIGLASSNSNGLRWTATENLHLTLKFLGEVNSDQTDRLVDALRTVVGQTKRFVFTLGTPGCFPNFGNPRIIWVGVFQGLERLRTLAGLIEETCSQNGFPSSDKPFQPHLTVARAGRNALIKPVLPDNFIFQSTTGVDSCYLFESKLTSGGPNYRIRAEFSLK